MKRALHRDKTPPRSMKATRRSTDERSPYRGTVPEPTDEVRAIDRVPNGLPDVIPSPSVDDPLANTPVFSNAFLGLDTFALPQPSGANTTEPDHELLQPKRALAPIDAIDSSDYSAMRQWMKDSYTGLEGAGPSVTPSKQRVDLERYDNPSKVPGELTKRKGIEWEGANQSGIHPKVSDDTPHEAYALPGGASYQGAYSSRLLTYLSTVSRSALEMEGLPPVEVQFGHAFNDEGAYQLFASTNNLASQQRLWELLADPSALVKQVALAQPADYRGGWDLKPGESDLPSDEVDARAKHAMKLAAFPALQERRQDAVTSDLEAENIGPSDAESRRADLELTERAYQAFATGDVTVAMNPATQTERKKSGEAFFGAAERRLQRTKKRLTGKQAKWQKTTVPKYERDRQRYKDGALQKKPKPPQKPTANLGDTRHAEQNVASAMHSASRDRELDGESRFTHADIQGTMIRCMSCSAELGSNLTDGVDTTGRLFARHASIERLCACCEEKKANRSQTVTGKNPVAVPGSPGSPIPTVWEDSQEDTD